MGVIAGLIVGAVAAVGAAVGAGFVSSAMKHASDKAAEATKFAAKEDAKARIHDSNTILKASMHETDVEAAQRDKDRQLDRERDAQSAERNKEMMAWVHENDPWKDHSNYVEVVGNKDGAGGYDRNMPECAEPTLNS